MLLIVHASQPYDTVGNTIHLKILSLVHILCPFQMLAIFLNLDPATASLLLISGVDFAFSNLYTYANFLDNDPIYSTWGESEIFSPEAPFMARQCCTSIA